jgi:hypothetical protein
MPIAVTNLGWKLYMINGAWDVLIVFMLMYWWIETKGKTLEEIDRSIEGVPQHEALSGAGAISGLGVGRKDSYETDKKSGGAEKDV